MPNEVMMLAAKAARNARVLRRAEIAALILAGVLIGRAYSFATAQGPVTQWWSIKASSGGFVAGPFEIVDGHGTSLLKVPPGGVFGQTDGPVTYACVEGACDEGARIQNLWISPREAGGAGAP